MARLAATAVLLLSLLAVASCRVLEAEPETVVAISDEQGGQADPAVHEEANDVAEAIPSLPVVTLAETFLRLPSNRRPCRHGFLQRHLRWARHHGLSHRRGAFAGPGYARVHPTVMPEEPREAVLEAVAEPDPDTRPDTEGEQKSFHGDEEEEGENESVKAWKAGMLRRFHGHGLRFHHRHHHHEQAGEKDDDEDQEQQKEEGSEDMHAKLLSRHFHHHHGDEEQNQEQQDKEEGAGGMAVKLFRHRFHHHHGDEEQDETARKHYFHHHHDSDNEVDEVEELARRLSKAIMRRNLSRGGIRHHLHHHHQAEEGGVRNWFRGLLNMNRF